MPQTRTACFDAASTQVSCRPGKSPRQSFNRCYHANVCDAPAAQVAQLAHARAWQGRPCASRQSDGRIPVFRGFWTIADWYHCPRTPQVRWSADAPRCPADPVPVPGRRLAIPGAGRAAGPDPGRGRHRGRAPGRDGRLSVLLPAAGHGSDATPGRPSLAEHAAQRLRLRARPAPGRRRRPWANPDMPRHGLAGPERRPRGAVRARHRRPAVHADAGGPVERRFRRPGQAQHRHRQGQHRAGAARLERHPAVRHAAHRRAHHPCPGPAADPGRRSGRVPGGARPAGWLRDHAAVAMEPAAAGNACAPTAR